MLIYKIANHKKLKAFASFKSMGFLDKLKGFFSEEVKPVEESKKFSLDQLKDYLNEESEKAFEKANEKFSDIRQSVSEEKESLGKNLDILAKAELKNTEIPARVKQVMEGNRQTYIKRMESFGKDVNVPEEFSDLVKFSEKFDRILGDFEKSIAKNHHVMLEFFVKEATAVSTNVKNIDKLTKDIKKTLDENKITDLEKIKGKLGEVKKRINDVDESKRKIEEEREALNSESNDISTKKYEIEKLKESEQYSEFLSLTGHTQNLEKEFASIQSEVNHSFSEVGTALKKYSNLNKSNKLVKSYLEEPIKTLIEDRALNIKTIVADTKKEINDNRIDLKDKKREKTLKELENLTEDYFKNFLEIHRDLKEKMAEAKSQIGNSEIDKKVKLLKNELEQNEMKLLERKKLVSKMEKDLGDFDVGSLKKELEEEITNLLKKEIKII